MSNPAQEALREAQRALQKLATPTRWTGHDSLEDEYAERLAFAEKANRAAAAVLASLPSAELDHDTLERAAQVAEGLFRGDKNHQYVGERVASKIRALGRAEPPQSLEARLEALHADIQMQKFGGTGGFKHLPTIQEALAALASQKTQETNG